MYVRGVPLWAFQDIVNDVSRRSYGGHVTVHPDSRDTTRDSCRARVDVASSRGPGARRARSGRRLRAACWHAYRDVLAELFDRYPDATVRTALATYRGNDGFHRDYPATGDVNIGSRMDPVTMPELCDCGDASPFQVVASYVYDPGTDDLESVRDSIARVDRELELWESGPDAMTWSPKDTPDTDPAFVATQATDRLGVYEGCQWQTGYGLPWTERCDEPIAMSPPFAYCPNHLTRIGYAW